MDEFSCIISPSCYWAVLVHKRDERKEAQKIVKRRKEKWEEERSDSEGETKQEIQKWKGRMKQNRGGRMKESRKDESIKWRGWTKHSSLKKTLRFSSFSNRLHPLPTLFINKVFPLLTPMKRTSLLQGQNLHVLGNTINHHGSVQNQGNLNLIKWEHANVIKTKSSLIAESKPSPSIPADGEGKIKRLLKRDIRWFKLNHQINYCLMTSCKNYLLLQK